MKRESNVLEPLCIFTPTYNRAYCLSELFASLKRQTSFEFCWLIVDDGSIDNTEDLVRSFRDENPPFQIEYIKQENGGKQRAFNTGVNNCKNELFFCVDSDDRLVEDSVASILDAWQSVRYNPDIAGIIGLDGSDASTPLTKVFPEGISRTTLWNLYSKYGYKGDTALVYRTEVLALFPFEVYEGEKFMAESFVYNQIDQFFEMFLLNKIVQICCYREDGYTSNVRRLTRDNPRSYAAYKRQCIEYSETFVQKFESSALYLVGCIFGGIKGGIRNAPYPTIAALAYLPARLLCVTVYRDKS